MSYGVVTSKSAQLMLQQRSDRPTRRATAPAVSSPQAFTALWGTRWAGGRITLTRVHLSFVSTVAGARSSRLEIPLTDIESVSITEGRTRRVVGIHTADADLHVRVGSPLAFAKAVATAVEERRSPAVPEQTVESTRAVVGGAIRPRVPREGAVRRPSGVSTLAMR